MFKLRVRREKRIAAQSPFHLPWTSHRSVVREVLGDMNTGNTMTLAAGIAYFAALAFSTFAATFAISSIIIPEAQVATVVRELNAYLPQDIAGLITAQLEAQSGKSGGNFVVAIIAIGIALFAPLLQWRIPCARSMWPMGSKKHAHREATRREYSRACTGARVRRMHRTATDHR